MDDLSTELSRRGFDVLAPFRVSWYNEYIQKLGLATDENHVAGSAFTLAPLPNLGQEDALALIVGNSKAMWPNMLRWLKSQPNPTVLGPAPALLPPLLTDEEKAAAKVAFAEALKASSEADMSVHGMPLDIAQKWAAMRDCVGIGREYQYDDSQSEYHYTKNPEILVAALAALDAEG